ncbi:RDD family protein [Candidatus Fermentibacteria bacterium]|nr:RDD family protein [Candidatus Fermentibacteria bacterium]
MNGDVAQTGVPVSPELQKADPTKRIIATLIDGILAGVVSAIPVIGGIVGAAYMLLRDALPIQALEFKSVGKKLMGLSVVMEANPTAKIDYATSAKRNWMFAIGPIMAFFMVIPVLGWLINIVLGIAMLILGIMELMKVFSDPKGKRLGDTMAGTMVIEVAPKTA